MTIFFDLNKVDDLDYYIYYSSYMVMGTIGVMQEWIKNDMDLAPKKVAKIIYDIILQNDPLPLPKKIVSGK